MPSPEELLKKLADHHVILNETKWSEESPFIFNILTRIMQLDARALRSEFCKSLILD